MTSTRDLISDVLPVGPVNVGRNERILTAGLGGALLLLGLNRGRGLGTAMAVGGGVLLARAVTGHCPAYQSLGFSTGDSDGAAVSVRDYRTGAGSSYRSADTAEVLSGPNPDLHSERPAHEDRVEHASELSFPASDPPGYYPDKTGG